MGLWGSGLCNGAVDSGCHEVSENIWFEYCRMSYSGEMVRSAGFWVGLVGLMGLCG